MSHLIDGARLQFVVGESKNLTFAVTIPTHDSVSGKVKSIELANVSGWAAVLRVRSSARGSLILSAAATIDADQSAHKGRFYFGVAGSGIDTSFTNARYQVALTNSGSEIIKSYRGYWDVVGAV